MPGIDIGVHMIKYKCEECNITTELSECPNCGKRTELQESVVFWCEECNIPLYEKTCPICGKTAERIGSDLRPVFPEERLLLEILLDTPFRYKNASVWNAAGNHYYADGKKINFSVSDVKEIDLEEIKKQLQLYTPKNTYSAFDEMIVRFILANRKRYEYIVNEATQYIREKAEKFQTNEMFVSFSGGKDSTVVSSLVLRALSNPQILHIFGDTTLEFPETLDYVARFKKDHPKTPVLSSRNRDKDFFELCEVLGPPSRVMRWCCTVFKTGAIQRKISTLFRNKKQILTFYGIRRSESNSRKKYDKESDSPKISIQKTVSPIIDWFDFDIWLYILTTKIDFNLAYRLGYTRVGCWCCPNNSGWSGLLSSVYMPQQYEAFRDLLIRFAKNVGKPDPEEYVDSGNWKARQGGNGLSYAQTSVITFEPCVLQENTVNFELQKPITEELYELFKPFGYINKELGNQRLGEVYVVSKRGELLLKLQGKIGTTTLKVSLLSRKSGNCNSFRAVEDKIKSQITKYQMCMGCLGCESVCRYGAINIVADKEGLVSYQISDQKCVRCGECISHFDGGCYMRKVMTIKR
jgi:phosphoadenosine phosphosulfate reductase